MIAYHNDPKIKADILAQLETHAAADQIVKGQYWQDGKGCAIGCTIHSNDHMEYEARFGIPVMLARLEDCIFEGLPNDAAKTWPIRFMSAIEPGIDLSTVGWKFLHWLLTDETINPGITDPLVKDVVRQCADVLVPLTMGQPVDQDAAEAAYSAAWSSASNAWLADDAARSAGRAARSAGRAARAADAARSAGRAARSAGRVAWDVVAAADADVGRAAAYVLMADKLLTLIADAQPPSEKQTGEK